jgi:hypothetical protein
MTGSPSFEILGRLKESGETAVMATSIRCYQENPLFSANVNLIFACHRNSETGDQAFCYIHGRYTGPST